MSFCDTVYTEKEKRNLILLQCCDKLLFPVVISESIRMDGVGWKLEVVTVASDTALGMTSVVLLELPAEVMVEAVVVRDAVVVETSTVAEVVGRSEKQKWTWHLVKTNTQRKSQKVR